MTVDLIPGRPGGQGPGVQSPVDHRLGQRWLGGEPDGTGHAGSSAPFRVIGPGSWQVQGPVDERVPGRGSVGQVDRDLAVLDPAGGAGVLTLDADVAGAL